MRVLLAEGSTLFRQGLRTLLGTQPDIEVVGEAADSWETVAETRRLVPDLVILEIGTPSPPGLDHLGQIIRDAPEAKVLVLADSGREEDLWQTLQRGASGFILKNSDSEQLFRAIDAVMRGELAVSPTVSGGALRSLALRREETPEVRNQLTTREKEVLALLSGGRTDRDIGQQLSLSASTVGHHVHNILRKLNLKNRVQAATLATAGGPSQDRGMEGTKWTNRR
jgi:DNA-binding NarL/FixJ family response regulator